MQNIENILKERKTKKRSDTNKSTIIDTPQSSVSEKSRIENNLDTSEQKKKLKQKQNQQIIVSESDNDDDYDPFVIVVPDQKPNIKMAKR
jgi:hypothetical protein